MSNPRSDGGTNVQANNIEAKAAETAVDTLRERSERAARQLGSLVTTEIRLGLRRRWAVILIGLFTAFGLLVLTFAGSPAGPAGFERIVASLAMLCVYIVPLAGLAYGYDAIIGPAESGWLDVLTALPVTRFRVLLGTALGRGVVLTGGITLGFVLPSVAVINEYGLAALPVMANLLLAVVALGLGFLSIAVGLSTIVREKTHALGAALLAWVWFVLVYDLLALGFVAALDLPDSAVTALVLTNPTAVFRVFVLGGLGAGGSGGFTSLLAATGLSTALLAAALVGWIVVPVGIAGVVVSTRGTLAAT